MTHHVPNAHPPHLERRLSNVGHWVEGAIITAAGIAGLRESAVDGGTNIRRTRLLAGAGILLGAGLVAGSFQHGGPVTFFKADDQQRQHLQMAALLTGASLASERGRLGALAAGAATGLVGRMFLTHEQHGTGDAAAVAQAKHRRLGRTIVAGSAATTVGDLFGRRRIRAAGSALMAAAGLQLLTYREPQGAFED